MSALTSLSGTKWSKSTSHAHLQNGTDQHTYYFVNETEFVFVRIETEAIPFATTDRYLSFTTGTYSINNNNNNDIEFKGDKEPDLIKARQVIGAKTYHYADMTPIRDMSKSMPLAELQGQFRKQPLA